MADFDVQLRRQVQHVENLVVQVGRELQNVGSEVSAVNTAQRQTQSDLAQLRADFLAFTRASERRALVQRSETRIGVLQDQLEHEYGHHKVVRRTSVGLLQAFDIGIVSEDVVRTVSDELMIQTPRYWLAPALVALSAWAADDQSLCERAIGESYRRSPGKTALFLTLVLRRQQRLDASSRWLRSYLSAQDPRALGRDFAVILEAVAVGAFGPAGRAMVDEALARWTEVLSDPAAHDAQVKRWKAEIREHTPRVDAADFPALSAISPEWSSLAAALEGAETHTPLVTHYRTVMETAPGTVDRIEDALDDILDRLVSEFDDDELPIQRELAYHHAVVEKDGDSDAADALADLKTAALEETLDYLTIQTMSALTPEQIGVSRATQQIAIAACRPWFEQAHAESTLEYRGRMPSDVHVQFSGSHNAGAQAFQLPEWTGALSEGVPALERSLSTHWDTHTARYLASLTYPLKKNVIIASVVTGLAFLVSLAINPVFGVLVLLIMGGIWAWRIWSRYQAAEANRVQAAAALESYKQDSIRQLREASAQLTDWGSRFSAADGESGTVRTFIDSLAHAGHGATPFERRSVHV